MSERWLRRDDDFLKFRPFQAIAAPPLLKNRSAARWSILQVATVLIIFGILLAAVILFMPLLVQEMATSR